MSVLGIAASLVLAANGDPSSMQRAEEAVVAPLADEVGHGPVIELDVFSLSGGPTSNSRFVALGVGAGNTVLVIPPVQVGWEFDQNAILIGLQLSFEQGVNGASGQTEIALPITFRRYMKHLQAYTFDPFVEGSFSLDLIQPGGNNTSMQFGFGFDVGFGGEYLFTRNFGLMGKVLLGFEHIPAQFGNGADINALGFGGILGVLVHF
jgi:hypothetical protein